MGRANEQIAARLGVSPLTVKVHLSAAFRQLGVKRRSDAVRLVLTRHADWLAHERSRRSSSDDDGTPRSAAPSRPA